MSRLSLYRSFISEHAYEKGEGSSGIGYPTQSTSELYPRQDSIYGKTNPVKRMSHAVNELRILPFICAQHG